MRIQTEPDPQPWLLLPECDLLALVLNTAARLDLVGLVAAGLADCGHDHNFFEVGNVRHLKI